MPESDCETQVIARGSVPIGSVMIRPSGTETCGCVIEVHSFALEERNVMLPRLYKVLAGCGCWTLSYRRSGRRALECSFDVELAAVVELYCGLVQVGLEMTEVSHRALTDLCVLRANERALRDRSLNPRVVSVRLTMNFVSAEEEVAVPGVIAASA